MKFFGVRLVETYNSLSAWKLDQIPNIENLEQLEISNLAGMSLNTSVQHLTEFTYLGELPKLSDLQLKNNAIQRLTGLYSIQI